MDEIFTIEEKEKLKGNVETIFFLRWQNQRKKDEKKKNEIIKEVIYKIVALLEKASETSPSIPSIDFCVSSVNNYIPKYKKIIEKQLNEIGLVITDVKKEKSEIPPDHWPTVWTISVANEQFFHPLISELFF